MRMTVGAYIVESLSAFGVRTIFGIPGHHILELYCHLDDTEITHVMGKNEEGVVRAAAAYGRVADTPGVAFVSAGPGAINATSGIGEAKALSLPLVVFVGGEPQRDGPHNADDPNAVSTMLFAMSKHHFSVDQPTEILQAVTEAFTLAQAGRPGPVTVQIPKDTMKTSIEVDQLAMEPSPRETFPPDEEAVQSVVEYLSSSKRPLIIVGQGGIRAKLAEEVDALAAHLGAPVATTQRGFSGYVTPERYIGGLAPTVEHSGARTIAAEADFLLLVGVRESLRRFYMARYDCPKVCLTESIERHDVVDEMVPGSLKEGLEQLITRLSAAESPWWSTDLRRSNVQRNSDTLPLTGSSDDGWDDSDRQPLNPQSVIQTLNEFKDDAAIITTDVGMHNISAMEQIILTEPYTYLGPENWGAMGHALPCAIGAKIAKPDTQVIALIGDGSFLMTLQEFKTAVEYDLDITILLFNNHQHNAIFADMRTQFGESAFTEVPGFDYVRFAESAYGTGLQVSGPTDFESQLNAALTSDEPCIVDIPIVPNQER